MWASLDEAAVSGHAHGLLAAIDAMIVELRKEGQDDINHRDRCQRAQPRLSRGGPAGLEEGMGFIELSGYLKDLQTGWHGLAVKLDNAIGVGVPKAADGGEAAGGEAAASETPPPRDSHDRVEPAQDRSRRLVSEEEIWGSRHSL